MDSQTRLRALQIALVVVGVLAVVGIYPLIILWPAGFRWSPAHSEYELMIVGLYGTLGLFLVRAARRPLEHLSLIWFAVWSSVVHAGIMTVLAWREPANRGHLVGDIALLVIVAAVFAALTPKGQTQAVQ